MSRVVLELLGLATHDATKVVRLSQIEKDNGGGYSCDLKIISGWITCNRRFFFDDAALSDALPQLKQLAAGIPASCVIKGQWEEDYLRLESGSHGHIFVSGELIEHSAFDQRLRFCFQTDQTILDPLAAAIRLLLAA